MSHNIQNKEVVKIYDSALTNLKRYIGCDVGTIYLQENCEVTIILGKGSKIHIVNEEESNGNR